VVNKDKVTILEGDPVTQFWLRGRVNRYQDYTFLAKVYDVGSVFGIENGPGFQTAGMARRPGDDELRPRLGPGAHQSATIGKP